MPTPDQERAAVHEAGHVLMAVLLGRGVRSVGLSPRPETSTAKQVLLPRGRPKSDADKAMMEGELMLLVAGVCAERALGVDERGSSAAGALDDLARATDLAVRLAGPTRAEATMAHFLSKVERMLVERSTVLSETAAALLAAGRLSADQVQELVPRR